MEWYRTSVSAGPSLEVLLAQIDAQVEAARANGRLTDTAQIYAVPSARNVDLYVNEAARLAVPAVNLLALLPSGPPDRGRDQTALIGP